MPPFYITTPIYYVNDRPHIGHCYTTLLADVAARFQRLVRGSTPTGTPPAGTADLPSVFFLTGTDEHADKVVTSAAEHGVSPQQWADQNAAEFKRAFEFIGSSHDDFIRTTEPRHRDRVAVYLAALLASGDVYRGEYTGWYDEGQEEYVTENAAREAGFKSTISGKPLVKRTEPCYFFRLSKYQDELRGLIERDEFRVAPDSRKSEVLGRLRPPAVLNDVPISRPVTSDPATQWGIRIPGDPAHRVYVWIDALFNYLSTVDTPARRPLWPASVHLIGKDILWFHSVIWPALLLALSRSGRDWAWVALPRLVFGHGWWVSEGQKMSKSLGNFIDLERLRAYAARFGIDALRWYLVTQGPLSGADADFSHAKFVEVYNADLANGIGNCASRVGNMIEKYFGGVLPPIPSAPPPEAARLRDGALISAAIDSLARVELGEASAAGARLVRAVDEFISATSPFKLAKDLANLPAVGDILYTCAESLRIASLLLAPAMPTKMADLWQRWNCAPPPGVPLAELAKWGGPHALKPGTRIEKGDPLFMRADPAEPAPT
ncbi:MAG: methionine--tRNA ligase [Phycisphaerae bacterium]|nr:methionine--tRNA ligase [Phycisphaerae bacterium]